MIVSLSVTRRGIVWGSLACLVLAGCGRGSSPAPSAEEHPALLATAGLFDGVREETLPNGFRVVLKPIPGYPTVTTMVAYKVGGADEELSSTGLSHYLEHLMFKGTERLMPGDIDRTTLRNGGANNAYTSEDFTVYHFDFAADRWEVALDIEADRMRNIRIDTRHEFEQEKGAVIEELQRNEDQPWDLEYKAILPLLFGPTAPYGHPVIGLRQHVRGATAEIIKGHYDQWYHPNNAALIVCGGFDPERALAKIKTLFGPIAAGKLPARKVAPAIAANRPHTFEMPSKFDVPRLLLGYNGVAHDHADAEVFDVISGVLSGGKTGRLYKTLVEGERVASEASSDHQAGRYPGWFAVMVALLPGKDRQQVEKLVLNELERLAREPVSDAELNRVRETMLSQQILGLESAHALANELAMGAAAGDLNRARNYLPRVLAVTPADIQRVAQKFLSSQQRVAVWSIPPADEPAAPDPARQSRRPRHAAGSLAALEGTGVNPPRSPMAARRSLARREPREVSAASGAAVDLRQARRVELPNGLVVLLLENHRLPVFVAQAYVDKVSQLEHAEQSGLARLMGNLLDEGTRMRGGPEIAELVENVGATMAFSSSGGSLQCLAHQKERVLRLFLECLQHADFPAEAFDRVREQQLAEIDEAELLPNSRAATEILRQIYGQHPSGRPRLGERRTVERLTRADCAALHARAFVPNNTTLVLVGDFDASALLSLVKRLTARWPRGDDLQVTLPAVAPAPRFTQKIITMPEAAQLHIYLGQVGIRRDNADFEKLEVMDYVLGTGPGFTDRLSSRIRDREGLAYHAGANITHSAGVEPGMFLASVGTSAANFDRVKTILLTEIERLRNERATELEVENAKKYLLGNMPFKFTTSGQIAGELLEIERYGLGLDYLTTYRQRIAAVTVDDVLAVARKHLDPSRMILVAAGAVDEHGIPLNK